MQNTKLMSLSLGRGQTIPSASASASTSVSARYFENDSSSSLSFLHPHDPLITTVTSTAHETSSDAPSLLSDDTGVMATGVTALTEASIQEYIGQTFPLVKNLDHEIMTTATSTSVPTNSLERKHSTSQPLPSQVASITRSHFHSFLQPPLSNNSGSDESTLVVEKSFNYTTSSGKKSRLPNSQKRLNGVVSLASLNSTPTSMRGKETESTGGGGGMSSSSSSASLQQLTPRKGALDLPPQALVTPSSSATSAVKDREKPTHSNRIVDKISLSGSNHPSRSNSPLTKSEQQIENPYNGSTGGGSGGSVGGGGGGGKVQPLSDADKSIESIKDEDSIQGIDRLVREKLQEAKAMNRQDSTNGAVMYQFSLWKGVQKRDPIPDVSLPQKISQSAEAAIELNNETPTRPPQATDQVSSSKKKTVPRLRGPRAAIEAQEDVASPHVLLPSHTTPSRQFPSKTSSEQNLMDKRDAKSKPTVIYPEVISRQSPFSLRKASKENSEEDEGKDFEESDEGEDEENDDDDENSNAEQQSSRGRASAFRNMVGSCKTNNISCGSIAETIQTEMGIPQFYHAAPHDDDDDNDDDDDDLSLSTAEFEEEDLAILTVAMDHDSSFTSSTHTDDFIHEEIQPKYSLELSVETIAYPLHTPHSSSSSSIDHTSLGPPLIRKKKKSRTILFDQDDINEDHDRTSSATPSGNMTTSTILVSASLSKLPTHHHDHHHPQDMELNHLSQSKLIRRKSASSGHMKKIRDLTSGVKFEINREEMKRESEFFHESRKTDSSSPSLLSEASEYDAQDELGGDEKNYQMTQTTTTNTSGGATLEYYDRDQHLESGRRGNSSSINGNSGGGNGAEQFSSRKASSALSNDELHTIHEFQWKKGNEVLGEGTFGQVFKGMNCSTGELLAVKQICLTDGTEEEVTTLRQEIDLMDSLKHPNIVRSGNFDPLMTLTLSCPLLSLRYVGTSITSRYLYIVLEYVPGGSVAGMLSQFGAFSEVLIR
jgi:hypothetical protein